jgi:hypothetical protein
MNAARSSPNERLAILEQKVSHMEEELDRMAARPSGDQAASPSGSHP